MLTYKPSKTEIAVPLVSCILLGSLMLALVFELLGMTALRTVLFTIGILGFPALIGIVMFDVAHYFLKERT